MITYKQGDILGENVEAVVNTVNCVGVMGRGIALQFKKTYPDNFKVYAAACKRKEVQPGQMFVFETGQLMNPRYIINFPTKRHWRGKSRMEDIESGLVALAEEVRARGIRSIAVPPLGAGLGGLDWSQVRGRIEAALCGLEDVQVVVFEPRAATVNERSNRSSDVPKMTPGRAALVTLMDRYLAGLLDPFVTLLELHKLMYFLQEAGEPLRLKYREAHYGPYAENLRHVLHAIEGHMVSGYADGGDAPDKQLELVPKALGDAQLFLETKETTRSHLERVSDLVDGFESPFGLELLSTVHWVATRKQPQTVQEVVSAIHGWNERKRQFSERQVHLALEVLTRKGWCAPLSGAEV
jgi:O-acetyl-ADP-ribose deacetylase (regulator of RNase III)